MEIKRPISAESSIKSPLIAEINNLRRNPAAYASIISAWAARSPQINAAATQEILWYLQSARPVQPLEVASGLTIIAQIRAQSPQRQFESLTAQLQPYGKFSGALGENSSDSATHPQEAIAQWLISAVDPRRQSRQNLLNPRWRCMGVYGEAKTPYRVVFAQEYADFADSEASAWAASDETALQALNQLRENPQSYLPVLQAWRDRFLDSARVEQLDGKIYCTKEGVDAVTEAMAVLEKTPSLPLLEPSWGMTQAGRDLVRYQQETGETGSTGRDRSSPQDRLERYGMWQERWAESLCYGQPNAQAVIRDLLISDGKLERRDREYLLNPQWQKVGIATGFHPTQITICTLLFARDYREFAGIN